jgi:hypothetical protein
LEKILLSLLQRTWIHSANMSDNVTGNADGAKTSMSKSERNKMDYQRRKARKLEDTAAEAGATGAASAGGAGASGTAAAVVVPAADAGLTATEILHKHEMGGERVHCVGECHWYRCYNCMQFYVPDRKAFEHPVFSRCGGAGGGAAAPVANVGREVWTGQYKYHEYD